MLKTVTFRDIRNPLFTDALKRLYTSTTYKSVQDSYLVSRIVREVEAKQKEAHVEWQKLVEKFAEKDEAGNVKLAEGGASFNVLKELSDEFKASVEDFENTLILLGKDFLNSRVLDAVPLSPAHLDAVECLREPGK